MSATTGVAQIGDYATPGTDPLKVQALLDLIPTPDTAPAQSGGGFLDEMSAAAAAQLIVEITALKGAVT